MQVSANAQLRQKPHRSSTVRVRVKLSSGVWSQISRTLRSRTRVGADLEAAREAKYRELRDLELDYRTGKLSDADYHATDAVLRSEALSILDRLEELDRVESEVSEKEEGEKEEEGVPA